jgi:secondary thiamine-phosphate synthase enzyme
MPYNVFMPYLITEIEISTKGFADVVDIMPQIEIFSREWKGADGRLLVFVPGATAAVTTLEYEPGAVDDLKASIRRLLPEDLRYAHDARWGDGNGFAHVRAAWFGPSLAVPVRQGRPLLGTWQQVVVLDFDNRPRKRTIVLQFAC